jgi:hypothetical protein
MKIRRSGMKPSFGAEIGIRCPEPNDQLRAGRPRP